MGKTPQLGTLDGEQNETKLTDQSQQADLACRAPPCSGRGRSENEMDRMSQVRGNIEVVVGPFYTYTNTIKNSLELNLALFKCVM